MIKASKDKETSNSAKKENQSTFEQSVFLVKEGSINASRRPPSQSSKTVTHSLTENLSQSCGNQSNKKGKSRLKRGMTTKYLTSNSVEEIVNNTLTGFLIKFIRENGAQPFDVLLRLVSSQYSSLRKLSGHMYSGNVMKSLKGALTANGLFEEINVRSNNAASDSLKTFPFGAGNNEMSASNPAAQTKWDIIDLAAESYLEEKMSQVVEQKNQLLHKSSYKIQNVSEKDSDVLENYSPVKFSKQRSDICSLRDSKLERK